MDFHPAFQHWRDADGGLERAEVGFGKLLLRLFPQGDEGSVIKLALPLGVRFGADKVGDASGFRSDGCTSEHCYFTAGDYRV